MNFRLSIFFLVICSYYIFVANIGPRAVGIWQDDAIYISTSTSLSKGIGYKHLEFPGTPNETKYPPLYSALLSFFTKISGSYPDNLFFFLLPNCIAGALFVVLSYSYLKHLFPKDRLILYFTGILTALSPHLVSFTRFTMSELTYSAISIASLYYLDIKYLESKDSKSGIKHIIISSFFLSMAFLTRSFGITLFAGCFCTLIIKKRYRYAIIMSAMTFAIITPWLIFKSNVINLSDFPDLAHPDLDYAINFPDSITSILRAAKQNFIKSIFGIIYFQFSVPKHFVFKIISDFTWKTVIFHLFCYALVFTIFLGFVMSLKSKIRTLHLYAIIYLTLMIAWPFEPFRFMIPWTPFIIFFLFYGIKEIYQMVEKRLNILKDKKYVLPSVKSIVFVLLMLLFINGNVDILKSTSENYHLPELDFNISEYNNAKEWIIKNTSKSDILTSAHPTGIFLDTGRQGYYFWKTVDLYNSLYGRDRNFWNFYLKDATSEYSFLYNDIMKNFIKSYKEANVKYYVESRAFNSLSVALSMFISRNKDSFRLKYTTPKKVYNIYEIIY